MRIIKTIALNLILLFIIGLSTELRAQVTIGSGLEPNKGALLDLKEKDPVNPAVDNSTAKKGLIMPRVNLTSMTSLADIDGAAGKEAKHTGLTVYNLSTTGGFEPGIYVWDGARWIKCGAAASAAEPGFFYMPSFNLPISTPGTNAYGIYDEYKTQFAKAGLHVYEPDEIEFKVTYYDSSLINNILFPEDAGNRYMVYSVLSTTAPEGAYINIIIVVK